MSGDYEKLCSAIEALVSFQEGLDKRLSGLAEELSVLRKVVNDEIIGGITNLYQENVRSDGISGLKSAYSEKIGDVAGPFSELYGADLWEKLYDALSDVAEAEREPQIMEIYTALKAKLDKVKGVSPVAVEAEVVAPAAEEKPAEDKAEEPAGDENPADSMDDVIKRAIGKLNGRKSGVMAGAR